MLELVAGALSIFGAAAVVYAFFRIDRRFPSILILIIALLDMGLALKFTMRATAWLVDPHNTRNRSE